MYCLHEKLLLYSLFPTIFFVVHCTNATFPLGLFDLIRLRHFIWNRKIKKQVTNPTFACETKQKSNWISTIEHVNIGKEVSAYCSKQHIVRHKPTTHYTQREKYPDEMRMKREMKKKTSHRLERVKSKVKKWMHTGKKAQTNK